METMTIQELKAKLSKYDENLEVQIRCDIPDYGEYEAYAHGVELDAYDVYEFGVGYTGKKAYYVTIV